MKERVEKAEELVKLINNLKEKIAIVKSDRLKNIKIQFDSSDFATSEWGSKRVSLLHANIEAHMINAFIDATEEEIAILEKELAEL